MRDINFPSARHPNSRVEVRHRRHAFARKCPFRGSGTTSCSCREPIGLSLRFFQIDEAKKLPTGLSGPEQDRGPRRCCTLFDVCGDLVTSAGSERSDPVRKGMENLPDQPKRLSLTV